MSASDTHARVTMRARAAGPVREPQATSLEEDLERSHAMLAALSHAQAQFIQTGDPRVAFQEMLSALLKIADSEYGFIGEVLHDDQGTPYLKTHAITNIAWNEETREFYDREAPKGMEFRNLRTLFGHVLETGEPVVANEPATDPRRGGLPAGHPALNAFLGLPLHHGEQLVGMVGIANRPGGYDDGLINYLEPLLSTCATVIVEHWHELEKATHAAKRGKRHALMQLLYNIGAQTSLDPQTQLDQALRWVTRDLGMAIGIISRIEGDRYAVDSCDAPPDTIAPGDEFALSETYCSICLELGGVVAIDFVAESDHGRHPCYEKFGLEAYVGTNVHVHGAVYGTVNFSSPEPRAQGWDEVDQEFIELLSIWVGSILERRIADEQLAESNREIRRMYHTLCHELKTPLTSLREFVSTVHDEIAGPIVDEQREYLAEALAGCDDLARHIDDLVDVTRAETGKLSCEPEPVDIGRLLGRVEAAHQSDAADRGITLDLPDQTALPAVWADPTRILQVLSNLIGNALKFTPDGGRVAVRVGRWADNHAWSVWTVEDTGRGIAPEDLEKIFDRLFQVTEDDWSTQGGLGLGLSICREIVRLHRGQIWVESELGTGTKFHFSIPFAGPHDRSR